MDWKLNLIIIAIGLGYYFVGGIVEAIIYREEALDLGAWVLLWPIDLIEFIYRILVLTVIGIDNFIYSRQTRKIIKSQMTPENYEEFMEEIEAVTDYLIDKYSSKGDE